MVLIIRIRITEVVIVVRTTIIRIFAVISSHGRELISVKELPCISVRVSSRVATMALKKEWSGRKLRLSHTSREVRAVMLTLVDGMKECVFSINFRMSRVREFVQEGLEIYEGANQNSVSFFFFIFLVTSHFYASNTVRVLLLIFNAAFTARVLILALIVF